ncbi:RICIN domain-containing protein [Streptomyces olivoreticuli]
MEGQAGPRSITMVAHNSHLLWHLNGNQTANDTAVTQYHDDRLLSSRWILDFIGTNPQGRPLYRLINAAAHKCLDVNSGQRSGVGDYLNIWDCHYRDGHPAPCDYQHDTQNFVIAHPGSRFPNLTVIRDNATGLYANIFDNSTREGAPVIQYPYQHQAELFDLVANEMFFLPPTIP